MATFFLGLAADSPLLLRFLLLSEAMVQVNCADLNSSLEDLISQRWDGVWLEIKKIWAGGRKRGARCLAGRCEGGDAEEVNGRQYAIW